eukprot:g1423.t1
MALPQPRCKSGNEKSCGIRGEIQIPEVGAKLCVVDRSKFVQKSAKLALVLSLKQQQALRLAAATAASGTKEHLDLSIVMWISN